MRRVLVVLIVLSSLLLLGQRLRVWLASDATRIGWRLDEMAEGFNETRTGNCLRGIAQEWRDTTSGTDRALLGDWLRALFFQEKDPETGRFLHRVELDRETLVIELDPQLEGRASLGVEVLFSTLEQGEWAPSWRVRVRAQLREDEDLGWQVVQSEHETLESDGRLLRRR